MYKVEGKWWGQRSVLLDENSQLYKFISQLREKIMLEYSNLDTRKIHTEICSDIDIKNGCDKNKLFNELLSTVVNVKDISKYTIIGRAFALNIGKIGNRERHITIVFGIQYGDLNKLIQITNDLIKNL
jgi:hypothetical protein